MIWEFEKARLPYDALWVRCSRFMTLPTTNHEPVGDHKFTTINHGFNDSNRLCLVDSSCALADRISTTHQPSCSLERTVDPSTPATQGPARLKLQRLGGSQSYWCADLFCYHSVSWHGCFRFKLALRGSEANQKKHWLDMTGSWSAMMITMMILDYLGIL